MRSLVLAAVLVTEAACLTEAEAAGWAAWASNGAVATGRRPPTPAFMDPSWWEGERLLLEEDGDQTSSAARPAAPLEDDALTDPCFWQPMDDGCRLESELPALFLEQLHAVDTLQLPPMPCVSSDIGCTLEHGAGLAGEELVETRPYVHETESLTQDACWWDTGCEAFA